MGFFKRNKGPEIPPVMPTPGQQDQFNDPYAARSSRPGQNDPYASGGHRDPYAGVQRANAAGNDPNSPYGVRRGPAPQDVENDAYREALFSGMQQQTQVPRARQYGYEGRDKEEDFDEDDEIEGIRQGMRETKMDSLASTRNALRLAREAEENAHGTIARLADQSGESESKKSELRHSRPSVANFHQSHSQILSVTSTLPRPTHSAQRTRQQSSRSSTAPSSVQRSCGTR